MVHAILNLNHAAAIIDGVGHAVKCSTSTLHGDFRPERHRRRCSAGVLAWIQFVAERIEKTALHCICGRIIRREQCFYGICCRTARLRAGIFGKRITRGNIVQRIDGRAVLVHTEMQVTASRAASCTNGRDFLTGGDFCALLGVERRGVPVKTHQTAAVVDADVVAVATVPAGLRDRAGTKREDWCAACRCQVYAVMEFLAVERAGTVTVAARNARVGWTRPNIFTHVLPSLTRQLEHGAGIDPPAVRAARSAVLLGGGFNGSLIQAVNTRPLRAVT